MEITLVGGKRGTQSSALDWDVRDMPQSVTLDGERFHRQGTSTIFVFTEEVPK